MTPTKEQAIVALSLVRDLSQERINLMLPTIQSAITPAAKAAFALLGGVLEEHFKSTSTEPNTP